MRLLLILTLTLFSATSVYASKARLLSLGQDVNGSLYLDDNRNIFLNPAYIHNMDNIANFEMGATPTTAAPTPNPQAEGGFVYNLRGNKLGFQMGRTGNAADNVDAANAVLNATTLIRPQNAFEIIYGMDGNTPMGFSLLYANSKSDNAGPTANLPDNTAQAISLRGGANLSGNKEVFAYFDVKQESKNEAGGGNTELTGKTNLGVGGKMEYSKSLTFSGQFQLTAFDVKVGTNTTAVESKSLELNATTTLTKSSSSHVFASGGLAWTDGKIDQPGASTDFNNKTLGIPVIIGFETEALSWMDLRGSVRQNVLINDSEAPNSTITNTFKTNNAASTVVAAGMSLKYDKLVIDGTLAGSTTGVISSASLITNASMTYTF